MAGWKKKTVEEISAMDPGQRARYQRKRKHRDSVLRKEEIKREKILADWRLHGERGTCSGCSKRGIQCTPPPADKKLRTKCEACSSRGRDCSIGEVLFKDDYIPMATRNALGISIQVPSPTAESTGQRPESQTPRNNPGNTRGTNSEEHEPSGEETRILRRFLGRVTRILDTTDDDLRQVNVENMPQRVARSKQRSALNRVAITKIRDAEAQANRDLNRVPQFDFNI